MFKPNVFRSVLGLLALVLVFSLALPSIALAYDQFPARGRVAVANRGSGSISVIDARAGDLIDTYPLPAGPNAPEPMYVVYFPGMNRLFVGDRANDRVVAFDARTLAVEATVSTGTGVFHMWADSQDGQLWVVADIDKTISVIDARTLEHMATVPIPADLAALGGKPHDVILDPQRPLAFATVLGIAGPNDYVVQFSTDTFEETGRAAVGKDPHLSLARQNDKLYVPAQNSSTVTVLDRESLAELDTIAVPGAHGAGMRRDGKVFYTTNLTGGGSGGLIGIDTTSDTVITPTTDTPYPVPHNIALTPDGHTIYVTHSGPTSDKVTIYSTVANDPRPVFAGEVTVGLNPFGITYLP
jgi:DNA-binding beta-propeller fold protein YncE